MEDDKMNCCGRYLNGTFTRQRTAILFLAGVIGWLVFPASFSVAQTGIRTAATQQTQYYGKWDHPVEPKSSGMLQPSRDLNSDGFQKLFPPSNPKPFENHPTFSRLQPPPVAPPPPRARSLNPLPQPVLTGQFVSRDTPNATVANYESDMTTRISPNGNIRSTFSEAWPTTDSQNAAAGMVDQFKEKVQSTIGDLKSNDGMMSRLTGFFTGQDNAGIRKVIGGLAVVLGGYFGLLWLIRRFNFAPSRGIPSEVIEVLGVAPFGPRKNLQLVRLGSKLLLLMKRPFATLTINNVAREPSPYLKWRMMNFPFPRRN